MLTCRVHMALIVTCILWETILSPPSPFCVYCQVTVTAYNTNDAGDDVGGTSSDRSNLAAVGVPGALDMAIFQRPGFWSGVCL